MYVCICNAVTDRDIRDAYTQGARTMPELQAELGVATCCGCCEPVARDVLESCQANEAQAAKPSVSTLARPGTAFAG